ncbi:conjugal transfer protein TraN [Xanthomonas citri pv. citri]|uniref:conjugal transfer protein TraN n=1 Tax=Xanthomonas citri TaxID=346 RepID=UPI0013DDD0B7|nr:conjugal transfer protein TraN [Xanthomonas citri]MBD4389078.1 conjugal transfer protein TraN [Xanthomonas citri pv. citri]MBD4392292.1 conjugal transfer protein TraN [Xanthomonas citri pv. citri]MBD4402447.1 conjugal transfer protein TraN [Xanthomonas citri pv. citri]MBD4408061.1 conjugal transfer protein TraN [Xanthomonas citri pv. citri]MBD4414787.1 conjugal transfer protein TraN [Xanthomonas citri pv. citri]
MDIKNQILLSLILFAFSATATGQSSVKDATGTVEGSTAQAGFTDGAGKNGTGIVQINGRSYQADEVLPSGANKGYVDRLKQIDGSKNLQGLQSAYNDLSPQIDKDPSSWAEATRTSTVVPRDMHRVQDELRYDNTLWEQSLQKLSDGGARETLGDMLTECKTTTVVTPGSKTHTYTEERYCDTVNIPAENGNKDVCERQAEYTETPTSDRKQKVSQLFVSAEGNGTVCKRETRAENYRDTLSGTITSTIDLTAEVGGLSCRREIIPESVTTQVTGEKSVALPIDQQIPANLCSREVFSELREAHTSNSMDAALNVNNEVGGLSCTRRRTLYRQNQTITKTYTAQQTFSRSGSTASAAIWMAGPPEPNQAQPVFVSARKISGTFGPGSFGPGDGSWTNSVSIWWDGASWALTGDTPGNHLCRSGNCTSTYEITYQVQAVSNVWGIAESGNCWDGGTAQCPTQWGCTQAAPTGVDGIWVSDAEVAQLGALYPGSPNTCVSSTLTRTCGGAATSSNEVNISSRLASGTTSISNFRVEVLNPQDGITVQTTQVPSAGNGWLARFNVVRTNFSYSPAAPQIRLYWISNVWTTFIGTRDSGNCSAAGSPNCPTRWSCSAGAPTTVNGVTISAADAASRAPLFPGAQNNCARASLDKVCSGTASMSSVISIADKLPEGTVSISDFQVQTLNPQSGVNVVLTQTPSRDNGWNAHYRVDRSNYSYQPVSPQIKMTWGATVTIIATKVTDTGNCSDPGSTACPTRWTCAANAPTTVNGIAVSAAMAQKHAPLFPGAIASCTTGHLTRVCDGSSALITSIYIGHLLSSDSTEISQFAWKVNNPQSGVTIELVEAPSLSNGWLAKFRGTRNYPVSTNPVKPSLTLNWNFLSELKVRTSIITTGDCTNPYGSIASAVTQENRKPDSVQMMLAKSDEAEVESASVFERTALAVLTGFVPTANASPMMLASMSALAASSCPVQWYCTKTAPGTANGVYVYPADLQQRGELYPGENFTCLDAEYRRECEGTGSNQTHISLADQIPANVKSIANYGWQIVDPGQGVGVRQIQAPSLDNGWRAIFETTRTDWTVDSKPPTVRLVWDQIGIPNWNVDTVDQGNCGQDGDEFCKTQWTCLESYPPDPPKISEIVSREIDLVGSDLMNGTVSITISLREYMGDVGAIHDFRVSSHSGTVDVAIVVEPSKANAWRVSLNATTKGFQYQYVAGKGLQTFSRGKINFAFKLGARPPYVPPPYRSQSPGPLYPGDDGSCKRAEKTMNCSGIWEGEQCFIDEDGKRECVIQPPTGEVPNECKRLADDESCTEVREECSEGGMSSTGHCYTGTKVYACKVTVVGDDVEIKEETTCEGAQPVPCADGSCSNDDKGTVSVSKAGAELVTSQTILMDYKVDGAPGGVGGMAKAIPIEKGAHVDSMIAKVFEAALSGIIPSAVAQENKDDAFGVPLPFPVPDPDPPGNPDDAMAMEMLSKVKLFTGTRDSCKKMLGGLLDCCTKDPPDSQKQWWERYGNFARENGMADLGEFSDEQNGDGTGVWDNYDASSDSMTLNQSFTSLAENINGGGTPGAGDPNATLEDFAKKFSNFSASNIRPKLGWYCKDHEKDLAIKKNLGQCTYLGSYCQTESLLGICIVKMHVSCCFNSTVSKSIRDHMAKDGRFGMGTAKRPQCGGIPLTQLINANMENFSTDEVEARMAAGGFTPNMAELSGLSGEEFDVEMFGSGNSLNDPNRKGLQQRTGERMDAVSPNIVEGYDAIDGAINKRSNIANTDVADPESPGAITFNPGLYFVDQGHIANVKVNRNGGKGTVSVTLRTISGGTAVSGTDFTPVNTTLTWAAGEVGTKSVGIQTTNRNRSAALTIMLEIANTTGGAVINPLSTATVEINKASE